MRRRTESATARSALLEVDNVRVVYRNGALGVEGVGLRVEPGQISALIGRNGAGKTTTLRAIAGFLRSEHVTVTGSILLQGRQLVGAQPSRTFAEGIVLVAERDKVFTDLTVQEHLRLAGGEPDAPTRFAALERLRSRRAGLLSGGERQMLALEVAYRHRPAVLLVDEMSLGLAPVIVQELMVQLRDLVVDSSVGVVLVEQDVVNTLKVADHVYVLDHGDPVWDGPASDTNADEVGERFLGVLR